MVLENIEKEIEVPENVEITIDGIVVKAKGVKGDIERKIIMPKIAISVVDGKVKVGANKATKREKAKIGTAVAHITNMIKGVDEGHHYELKICSGHFPMNVSISGNKLVIKNFLGEKVPREIKIKEGAKVKVDGDKVFVEGLDIEIVGQVAADIEQLTRVTNRDIRIFQDGIYIIKKPKKRML
ncbi:50S ribosomal protein L6 [Candidatus Woesearchaeota archaeon]|nr:50S ribosomal protein L6 [Candidatus Woesearchaeota archaeon]